MGLDLQAAACLTALIFLHFLFCLHKFKYHLSVFGIQISFSCAEQLNPAFGNKFGREGLSEDHFPVTHAACTT